MLSWMGIGFSDVRNALDRHSYSCRELTQYYLNRINNHDQYNAFITICHDRALKKAAEVDHKLQKGTAGMLAGLILAIKDNISIDNEPLTCGSRILSAYRSPYSATVIERVEQADAIIIGKTNMDEFGMGSSNEYSWYGPVKNPHALDRVAGGSSGGSAAAVAADLAMAALGSDTGGSVRQPAAFCGVVGLKPTYGRVSRFGLVAFASSLDQIGIITRNIPDAALLLQVIAGHDPRDATSSPISVPYYSRYCDRSIAGLKIGWPTEYFVPGLDQTIRARIELCRRLLEQGGATFIELSLPHFDYAVACYYVLASAEAASNLARFDGVRYGFRHPQASDLDEMYDLTRSEGFGPEVKRRIMLGNFVLSSGYYDQYYQTAQRVRALIKQDFDSAFEVCDCLIAPTTATPAFRLGEKTNDPLSMYLSDLYTVSANLGGLPSLTLPVGNDPQGLPIGVQFLAKPYNEPTLFQVGSSLERAIHQTNHDI
ncbi:MAG: Asp-tRNA(Asn)/Glu-tRNA(Gln) amidotransferase subunit GatA [candidate division KSB1 bacterium]|nr:Asp-tRNA(Asn)/Glu-tRNA(Gln) amidotransferase subunit GatA [candidate division KSB1 bacterium]MDZ7335403.1 Asp-tRNA(Asn)/Glu-tRNA(Gln) amidotransferase subunit GatA [candidate division KSB1 bacterium]MDZ7356417.1 Asp-tRNA(Asn)/Glu-tRNA(Gln) amidotransferase subunit GatA [candidate division KSB1 bacterium]MDZ7401188.1 Asp-tRNA(Asn)/Glu-tRNA(Gln) amidotransferase subunit GatA [candidate division KSB1 bacterium]